MTARPIIIDCDPGQDDAVALLLAMASPDELEIRGITCVAGNVPLELTAANARRVAELAGRTEIPVFAGCARPLVRPLVTAEYVHGKTGLDGCDLPPPAMALDERHAVDFIVAECLAAGPDGITLCPTGPLTNIATAIGKAPEILPHIAEIVLMGGAAMIPGNTTPSAEFNIYVDPHAADAVFECGRPIVMHPLDVTHKAITTPQRLDAIRAIGTPVSDAVAGMLEFYDRFDMDRYGMEGGPLHDPCVIAYLLRPGLFAGRRARVCIETQSELTMGRTVVDWWGITGDDPNALVINEIEADGFYALITERLARL
ncbi:MAG: nucleoside hydrolase [Alphaproteobacteria bacterium]|nr:nucleoside hydrolase [Alphaproteobacteria bacterium]